jgi:hypothetical protein
VLEHGTHPSTYFPRTQLPEINLLAVGFPA